MSVFLLKDHDLKLNFKRIKFSFKELGWKTLNYRKVSSSLNLLLQCETPSSKGLGVDADNRFPWKVSPLAFPQRLRGKNGAFSLHFSVYVFQKNKADGLLTVHVDGDFQEILEYVFSHVADTTTLNPNNLGLNFIASVRFEDNTTTTIPLEMTGKQDASGNIRFEKKMEKITEPIARKFVNTSSYREIIFTSLAVELIGVGLDVPPAIPSSSGSVPSCSGMSPQAPQTSTAVPDSGSSRSVLSDDLQNVNQTILEFSDKVSGVGLGVPVPPAISGSVVISQPVPSSSGMSPQTSSAVPGSSSSNVLSDDLQNVNQTILEFSDKNILSDYALVAKTGKSFPCNKVFLAARSAAFKVLFQAGTEENKLKQLDLSEEGVKALLNFVYCTNVDIPGGSFEVAVELLGIANEWEMPSLEKAMKLILLGMPEGWFGFYGALELFLDSMKSEDYEDVKRKAAKALKLYPNRFKAISKEVCKSYPEAAAELLSIFIQQ